MKLINIVNKEIIKFLFENNQSIINYLKNKNIDYDDLSYLGRGDFGEAYATNDNRVVKFTTSKSEFDLAQKIKNAGDIPVLDHIVDIYDTDIIDNKYVIIMEELEEDSEIEDLYYQLTDILESQGLPVQYVEYLDVDELNEPLSDEMVDFINVIEDINRGYRYLGVEASDIRPENMGRDRNNIIKAFDIDDKQQH